jgi:hypothetical protein
VYEYYQRALHTRIKMSTETHYFIQLIYAKIEFGTFVWICFLKGALWGLSSGLCTCLAEALPLDP